MTRTRAGALVGATLLGMTSLGGVAVAVPPPMTLICENQGGNLPPGQQGRCVGQGLDEAVVNPAGKRPPGQQP
jgi:hypothetical protein